MDRARTHTIETVTAMKSPLILIAAIPAFVVSAAAQQPTATELAAWKRQAQNVTITRDDWGIAHVHGKTDADAVFGAIYAQAEDDFNRIETNYLTQLGRLGEFEGAMAAPLEPDGSAGRGSTGRSSAAGFLP